MYAIDVWRADNLGYTSTVEACKTGTTGPVSAEVVSYVCSQEIFVQYTLPSSSWPRLEDGRLSGKKGAAAHGQCIGAQIKRVSVWKEYRNACPFEVVCQRGTAKELS